MFLLFVAVKANQTMMHTMMHTQVREIVGTTPRLAGVSVNMHARDYMYRRGPYGRTDRAKTITAASERESVGLL